MPNPIGFRSRMSHYAFVASLAFFSGTACADLTSSGIAGKLVSVVHGAGDAAKVVNVTGKQAFMLHNYSERQGDSLTITLAKAGESFRLDNTEALQQTGGVSGQFIEMVETTATPIRGPATVTITGKGLVSYEVQAVQ